MDFFNEMRNEALNNVQYNMSVTENGALGFATTGKYLLDMNFKVASMRRMSIEEIKNIFSLAYMEDSRLAILWLFYIRDIREGLGERRLFKCLLPEILKDIKEENANKLIDLISEYGRFDDLYCVVEECPSYIDYVAKLFKDQLSNDIDNMEKGKSISLLAKWLKSEKASSKVSRDLAFKTMHMLGLTPRKYRKLLSKMRAYLNVVEVKMTSNNWGEIKYEHVPSKASLNYKNAFTKHDKERYEQFINKVNKGEAKINASTLYPHEIVAKYINSGGWSYDVKSSIDNTLEALWKNLPDTVGNDSRTLVVADGSGSMTTYVGGSKVRALDVANALAIYFAERAQGPYKDKYITFSSSPKFVDFTKTNCKSLRDKISYALKHDEVANTNIEKVFQLILDTAIKNKCSQDEIPNNILILSDMEFDSCASSNSGYGINKSLFQTISNKYEEAGYKLPRLVFWNLNSRTGTIPVIQNDLGVALISGFSTNLVKMVLDGETDPYKCLVKILESDRYKSVSEALQ